ncbi:Uncharacterized protein SAPIO_CDS1193 [Scedosporium apiospermum]|uniref:AB hydrolase-1 domain-containing protein n=1 Tax=Pseudallescheria apiosperma TaxID=563466 RepID=A0A084GG17_PSEDA|nr:Uncharacterized protein SAPIO_CDS1193 [Scedosporium apiospermum]KEZ46279.1 Uncharacterized protein SAPIO_CDS1193 [Scedosporium apiospermum]
MPFFNSSIDSTRLFYRDYVPDGKGFKMQAGRASKLTLVFLHGWPMSSKMFEHLIVPLCETYQFRCIAPDRRGFGSSDWTDASKGKTTDWSTFAGDVAQLLETLAVGDFVFVAASMGCTESVLAYHSSQYISQHCKGFVWIGLAMPFPLQTPEHPLSPTQELWDSILQGLRDNRPAFVTESLPGVFAMHAGNQVHPKTLEYYEQIVSEAHGVAIEKTVAIFTQASDKQLTKLAESAEMIPILALHGDSDQGMPLEAGATIVKEMLPWADLRVYKNAGHGLYLTHAQQVIDDLVKFVDGI